MNKDWERSENTTRVRMTKGMGIQVRVDLRVNTIEKRFAIVLRSCRSRFVMNLVIIFATLSSPCNYRTTLSISFQFNLRLLHSRCVIAIDSH
jgi:hypothetical protein